MIHPAISRRRLVAAACLAPLVGCSMLTDPPQPQMYRLAPADLDPASSPVPRGNLAIAMPNAPQNLDTDRIALTRGATRFEYFADSTWTDRVPAMLQTLLVEAFESDGRVANVWTEQDSMTAGYRLQTAVRAFTARYNSAAASPPVAEVSLDLRLIHMPEQKAAGRILITEQQDATQNDLGSVVRAFDVATGKALNRCVQWTLAAMDRT
ncbi:MAG TPA: ABC-type transport auxiliary lipoprotein family protein [Acetobacteraceae bacterium]|jgi:cholesterol transport system auxiliary component|nr:ABC-type transport auxiliary lipoprotein family protein [Acetobacteraceae bacterium]